MSGDQAATSIIQEQKVSKGQPKQIPTTTHECAHVQGKLKKGDGRWKILHVISERCMRTPDNRWETLMPPKPWLPQGSHNTSMREFGILFINVFII